MSERIEFAKKPRRSPRQPDGLARRAPLIRVKYLIGIAALISLGAGLVVIGLPHLRWSYQYIDRGEPFYLRCGYAGPWGLFTVKPADGKCPLIDWFREKPR